MARWTLLAAALALAACGSIGFPGTSVCSSGISASIKVSNEYLACKGEPTTTSAQTSTLMTACNLAITGCSSQDQSALTTESNCIGNLPPIQCAWLDAGVNPDAGYSQWQTQLNNCTPTQQLSSNCSVKFTPSTN